MLLLFKHTWQIIPLPLTIIQSAQYNSIYSLQGSSLSWSFYRKPLENATLKLLLFVSTRNLRTSGLLEVLSDKNLYLRVTETTNGVSK